MLRIIEPRLDEGIILENLRTIALDFSGNRAAQLTNRRFQCIFIFGCDDITDGLCL